MQALELDENYGQAQKEGLLWFFETLSQKFYEQILKDRKSDFKKIFQSDAVKKAFQFLGHNTGLSFLFQIQEADELAKFVHSRLN